MVNITWACRGN